MKKILHERLREFASGDTVQVKWDDGYVTNGVAAKNLTHREPDSLQKLAEYLDGKYNLVSFELDEVRNRLTALMERDA